MDSNSPVTNQSTTLERPTRPARLWMKPHGPVGGYVDGGWWPRTRDAEAAFTELVTALVPWTGPVVRIAYNLDEWHTDIRRLMVGKRCIRLEGFRAAPADTVAVTGTNRNRVSLLVVPPGTPAGVAHAALRTAADPDVAATVAEILTSTGIRLDEQAEPTRMFQLIPEQQPIPEQQWETEGGRVNHRVDRVSHR